MIYKISNLRKLSENKITYRTDIKELDRLQVIDGIGMKGLDIKDAVGNGLLLYTGDFFPGIITSKVVSISFKEDDEVEISTLNSIYRFKIEKE